MSEPSLQLHNRDDKQVTLTVSNLEQLFARAEIFLRQQPKTTQKRDENTTELSLAFLGRFGLQTPLAVQMYLESPEGEEIIALLEEELAEVAAIEQQIQQEQLTHERHKHVMIAFLLAGLLHKHAAHAHHIAENEQALAEKKRHEKHTHDAAQDVTNYTERNEFEYRAYEIATDEIEKLLHTKQQAAQELEQQLADLAQQHQKTEAKYNTFDEHLNALLSEFSNHLKKEQKPATDSDPTSNLVKSIDNKIDRLTHEMDSDSKAISALLSNNHDDEARALMNLNNAKNLQIAALREISSVAQSEGEKVIYNNQFKPAKSYEDAAYILTKGTHVEEENGKRYLLKMGQSLDNMKPEEKNAAEKQYNHLKPTQIMSVRELIKHNRQLENTAYHEVSRQSEMMQRDLIFLTNKLSEMQAVRSNAELALKPAPTSTPALNMTPLPTPKPKPSSLHEDEFEQSYKRVIDLMHHNASPSAIAWLKAVTERMSPSTELKKQLNNLKPGMPIPETTMKSLLAVNNIGRAWQDMRAPDVEAKVETQSAPSPFRMKPHGGS